jgi:hypothetical protein
MSFIRGLVSSVQREGFWERVRARFIASIAISGCRNCSGLEFFNECSVIPSFDEGMSRIRVLDWEFWL